MTDPSLRTAVWDEHLTETEREVYRRAGYWQTFGLGRRPALLVVDVEYNFTGDTCEPILDSIAKYSDSCGPAAWSAIPVIAGLLAQARQAGHPVVYTHGKDAGRPGVPRVGNMVVDEIRPEGADLVVAKPSASAFFGTGIADYLTARGVDTVVHVGCTTSGCVRASVVDAAAHGFRNAVVEEGVFDRARLPHLASLFDMHAKYADVVSANEARRYLASVTGSS
jgi:maleamate amidohydrolase